MSARKSSAGKSQFLGFLIGTTLLVGSGIGIYLFLRGFLGSEGNSPLSSAKVIPAQALIATYINTDPQAWSKIKQFGTPEAQQIVTKGLQNINQNLFQDSNISYEQDIKPWVGGVMIALLPPNPVKAMQSSPSTVQSEPGVLIVVGIKDKLSALNFANKLKAQKSLQSEESEYKGEKILETRDKGKSTYTTVLQNSYVLLAPNKQVIENAINTYKGDPSFAGKENAQNILSNDTGIKDGIARIYIPDYADMVQQLTALNPQAAQLSPQTIQQLKKIKSIVANMGIDDAGIRLRAVFNIDSQLSKFQYEMTPGKILAEFPTDTFAVFNGQGIKHGWENILEESKDYPDFQKAVDQVRQQLKSVNLDLDKEVIGWMDGEFAMGAVKSDQGLLAQVGFGGALVFDTSDRQTAETTLTKLDAIAKQQSLNVSETNINGKKITEWQTLQGTLVAHGWLDNRILFLAIGEPVAQALIDHKGQSIESTDNFKTATASLPKPNGGYFYIDMEKAITLIERFAARSQPIPPDTNAMLESMRGFAVTFNSPDKSTNQMEMLLALKPSK